MSHTHPRPDPPSTPRSPGRASIRRWVGGKHVHNLALPDSHRQAEVCRWSSTRACALCAHHWAVLAILSFIPSSTPLSPWMFLGPAERAREACKQTWSCCSKRVSWFSMLSRSFLVSASPYPDISIERAPLNRQESLARNPEENRAPLLSLSGHPCTEQSWFLLGFRFSLFRS